MYLHLYFVINEQYASASHLSFVCAQRVSWKADTRSASVAMCCSSLSALASAIEMHALFHNKCTVYTRGKFSSGEISVKGYRSESQEEIGT